MQEEAAVELNEAKKSLVDARNRSGEIVEQAKTEAGNIKNEILASAKKEANDKLADADKRIELKKKEARDEIHDEMVSVAMAAVAKLLDEKATSADDEKAIEEYISEVRKK